MERIRKSFRRKNKDKEVVKKEEENVEEEFDPGTVSESSNTAPRQVQTRMERIRQSFRFKSKSKKKGEAKKEDEPAAGEDVLQIEPFDKTSKFRKSLRLKRRKKSKKCTKFESDEENVRSGRCSFRVKYLGSIEVQESRGMEICEAAVKHLKKAKKKHLSATLHVSGDGLRVVEKGSSGMLVDQVIEKVSFCSPDRNYDKGFSYICRDGTSRRWLCHCFMSKEDSGERLSHAVGVAFAICLERKQQRETDCGVTMNYNETDGTFTRFGSFRQGTITERILDPQNFKPASPPPVAKTPEENPHAVARPHASDLMYQRQASFKGLSSLSGHSPFKRTSNAYSSLRETALPSNVQRREKSRISLILEETLEEDPAGGKIDFGMAKPAAAITGDKTDGSQLLGWSSGFDNAGLVRKNNNNEPEEEEEKKQFVMPQIVTPLPIILENKIDRQVARVPPVQQQTKPPQVEEIISAPVESNNPWDLVPDQSKLKQHSRSNSKSEGVVVKENPADSWLASLTSKISVLEERNVSLGFQPSTDEDLEQEFAAIAARNPKNKNTNPFKTAVLN